jgi:hypothetical protein
LFLPDGILSTLMFKETLQQFTLNEDIHKS